MTGLTQEEVDSCREAFNRFDVDRSGTIDATELKQVLTEMGQEPTEEELYQMIAECDADCSGDIDFCEFIDMIERQAARAELWNDEHDALDAFAACGGNSDGTGFVKRERLIDIKINSMALSTVFNSHTRARSASP